MSYVFNGNFMGIQTNQIVPGTSGLWGRTRCRGPGTAVQLTATAASILSLTIKALDVNAGTVRTSINSTIGLGTFGFPLYNTPDSQSLDIDSPSRVWIKGATTDWVAWFALAK